MAHGEIHSAQHATGGADPITPAMIGAAVSGQGPGGSAPPTGAVVAYVGTSAPSGWLLCDGTSYLRASQAELFAVIGTAYGAADGTHFNVPDLRTRFPLGKGNAQALGEAGGSLGHTHTGPADHAAAAHTAHSGTAVANHSVTQPGAHSAHVVTQPSGHSAHAVTQPSAHAVTQPGAHSVHVVTQPAAHVVTQPSAHAALGNHAHELPFTKVAGGTGVLRMLASSIFGTGTSRAPESQSAAPTANTTAAAVALSQAVTGGTPSAHAGTAVDAHTGAAVDAHSAHSGTAVDAHSGTAVDAHSAHAGTAVDAHSAHSGTAVDAHGVTQPGAHTDHPAASHGATGAANPPFVVLNYIVKT